MSALLRIRETGRESGLPPVQDQIQAYQRCDRFCIPLLTRFCCRHSLTVLPMNEIAGTPRVEGDEDEDDIDDLDNEFEYDPDGLGQQSVSDSLYGRLNTGRGSNSNISGIPANSEHGSPPLNSEIPLLTYGEEVCLRFPLLTCLVSFNDGISSHRQQLWSL